MKTSYQPLFEFQLLHNYYTDSSASQSFRVLPTTSCQYILNHHHILFRQTENGFTLFVEVVSDTSPPQLSQQLNTETLKLSFWVEVTDPLLLNISALPSDHHPGKELFYLDNLSDHRTMPILQSPLYLNDTTENSPLGDTLLLLTSSQYTHSFSASVAPVTNAILTLKDMFNNTLDTFATGPEPISEYRISLTNIKGMVAGRYVLTDGLGDPVDLYFSPELMGKPVFALIDLYNSTKDITSDNSEQVPAPYRFLSSTNILAGISSYTLKIDSRKTTWRYIIIKKYTNNGIDLNQLAVKDTSSAVTFVASPPDTKQIIFTASKALPLNEARKPIVLERSNNKIRDLPTPTLSTALQKPSGLTGFSSDIYIYV